MFLYVRINNKHKCHILSQFFILLSNSLSDADIFVLSDLFSFLIFYPNFRKRPLKTKISTIYGCNTNVITYVFFLLLHLYIITSFCI